MLSSKTGGKKREMLNTEDGPPRKKTKDAKMTQMGLIARCQVGGQFSLHVA